LASQALVYKISKKLDILTILIFIDATYTIVATNTWFNLQEVGTAYPYALSLLSTTTNTNPNPNPNTWFNLQEVGTAYPYALSLLSTTTNIIVTTNTWFNLQKVGTTYPYALRHLIYSPTLSYTFKHVIMITFHLTICPIYGYFDFGFISKPNHEKCLLLFNGFYNFSLMSKSM